MVTVNQITPVPISQLDPATTLTGNENLAIVQNSQTVKTPIAALPQGMSAGVVVYGNTGGAPFPNFRTLAAGEGISITDGGAQGDLSISLASGGNAAPATASYVVMSASAVLDHERILAVGSALSLVDGGANANVTIGTLGLTGAITSSANSTTTALGSFSSANLAAALTDETGTGSAVFATSPTLVTPVLGTPTSGNLANCTGLPVGSITGLGANVAAFLATPSSANLAAALTDETGSGSAVFSASPTFTGTVNGAAAIWSGNNTASAFFSTLPTTLSGDFIGVSAGGAVVTSAGTNNITGVKVVANTISSTSAGNVIGMEIGSSTFSGTGDGTWSGIKLSLPVYSSSSTGSGNMNGINIFGANISTASGFQANINSIFIGSPTAPNSGSVTANRAISINNQGAAGIGTSDGVFIAAQSGSATASYALRVGGGFSINGNGNASVNTAALATNATTGFMFMSSGNGTPSGTPVLPFSNACAWYYDYANNIIYVYNSNSAGWKKTAALT